jgi:hypothetical protein
MGRPVEGFVFWKLVDKTDVLHRIAAQVIPAAAKTEKQY